ncbi:hypothetical protein EB008_04640 [bacterium]|nr:hypothetical protein [bacterium]
MLKFFIKKWNRPLKKRDHIVQVRNKPFFRILGTMISAGVSSHIKRTFGEYRKINPLFPCFFINRFPDLFSIFFLSF